MERHGFDKSDKFYSESSAGALEIPRARHIRKSDYGAALALG